MKRLSVIALLALVWPAPALASWPWSAQGAARVSGPLHPAVVRVVAPGRDSVSYGSGTLIAINEDHGLVITNWHVVNEATGQISVVFPDGFRSGATVQKVDRDWDLAALAIWRPKAEPVRLANAPAQPGDMLTIAGYGSGSYRSASGRCTQYVAPGLKFPYEMVELAVSARQGDSGGPIFNSQGELAGVLFGEGQGRTAGSYCGRVKWFVDSIVPGSNAIDAAQIASRQQRPTTPATPSATPGGPTAPDAIASRSARGAIGSSPETPDDMRTSHGSGQWHAAPKPGLPTSPIGPAVGQGLAASTRRAAPAAAVHSAADLEAVTTTRETLSWSDFAGHTWGEQFKTVLATIGALALILQTLSWIGSEPKAKASGN